MSKPDTIVAQDNRGNQGKGKLPLAEIARSFFVAEENGNSPLNDSATSLIHIAISGYVSTFWHRGLRLFLSKAARKKAHDQELRWYRQQEFWKSLALCASLKNDGAMNEAEATAAILMVDAIASKMESVTNIFADKRIEVNECINKLLPEYAALEEKKLLLMKESLLTQAARNALQARANARAFEQLNILASNGTAQTSLFDQVTSYLNQLQKAYPSAPPKRNIFTRFWYYITGKTMREALRKEKIEFLDVAVNKYQNSLEALQAGTGTQEAVIKNNFEVLAAVERLRLAFPAKRRFHLKAQEIIETFKANYQAAALSYEQMYQEYSEYRNQISKLRTKVEQLEQARKDKWIILQNLDEQIDRLREEKQYAAKLVNRNVTETDIQNLIKKINVKKQTQEELNTKFSQVRLLFSGKEQVSLNKKENLLPDLLDDESGRSPQNTVQVYQNKNVKVAKQAVINNSDSLQNQWDALNQYETKLNLEIQSLEAEIAQSQQETLNLKYQLSELKVSSAYKCAKHYAQYSEIYRKELINEEHIQRAALEKVRDGIYELEIEKEDKWILFNGLARQIRQLEKEKYAIQAVVTQNKALEAKIHLQNKQINILQQKISEIDSLLAEKDNERFTSAAENFMAAKEINILNHSSADLLLFPNANSEFSPKIAVRKAALAPPNPTASVTVKLQALLDYGKSLHNEVSDLSNEIENLQKRAEVLQSTLQELKADPLYKEPQIAEHLQKENSLGEQQIELLNAKLQLWKARVAEAVTERKALTLVSPLPSAMANLVHAAYYPLKWLGRNNLAEEKRVSAAQPSIKPAAAKSLSPIKQAILPHEKQTFNESQAYAFRGFWEQLAKTGVQCTYDAAKGSYKVEMVTKMAKGTYKIGYDFKI